MFVSFHKRSKRRCKKCRCKPCLCKKHIPCYKITCGKKRTKRKKKYVDQKGGSAGDYDQRYYDCILKKKLWNPYTKRCVKDTPKNRAAGAIKPTYSSSDRKDKDAYVDIFSHHTSEYHKTKESKKTKSQKKNLSFKECMKADFRRDGDDTWDDLDSDELAEYRAEWKEETFGRKKK